MGYTLKLRESDHVAIPRSDVRAIIRGGSGDAALLYLYLANAGEKTEDADICRGLHWDHSTLEGAEEGLQRLGLLGKKEEVVPVEQVPVHEKKDYSRHDIALVLEQDQNYASLRQAVGVKLNRIMTEKDDNMLLGLYSDLGLPPDVIFLLVGHCIQRTERRYGPERRPTMRQVEKEGYQWKRMGLLTQELAVEYLKEYARKQELIPRMMEALHMGGRDPVSKELEYLERWIGWGFSPDVVENAYERTVFKCGKMEWKYLNGILRDWDKKGLHTMEEITKGDQPTQQEPRREGKRTEGHAPVSGVQDSVAWMKEYLKQTEEKEG